VPTPSPYILRPLGNKPDSNRPLRNEPVRRDEVRVYRKFNRGGDPEWLVTMPPGTYRLEDRGKYSRCFVGDQTLWQPLMDGLTAQYAAEHERWRRRGLAVLSQPRPLPSLEIVFLMGFEYECEHCGAGFLAYKLAINVVRLCSNKCERERAAAQQRAWREANPREDYYRQYYSKRDQRRTEARADRRCEHCGVAIEAARSTKRFCSGRCRIRAHHQRRKEAADGP
jgi:hypothetical protein